MANILIRDVPAKTLRQARRVALRGHHSVQEELRGLLIDALEIREGDWPARAERLRRKIKRSVKSQSNSVDLLRDDRTR